jgi:hypothetical protein
VASRISGAARATAHRRTRRSPSIDAQLDVDTPCGDAEITGVQLTFHPWWDNGFPSLAKHGLVADKPLLDAFAREYANGSRLTNVGTEGDSEAQMQDFFLIWLPNRLQNICAGSEAAPEGHRLELTTAEGFGTAQWLAHLGGYYAAVWLRACWTAFEGRRLSMPMRNRKFHSIYRWQLDEARDVALHGTDRDALEYSRATLRKNSPKLTPIHIAARLIRADRLLFLVSDPVMEGEAAGFGFAAGYLHRILPPSLNAPTDATPFTDQYFTADADRLLDAHFALPEPPFVSRARDRYAVLSSAPGQVGARLSEALRGRRGEADLLVRQQIADTLAAVIYRIGIPRVSRYRGFDQAQYDRLLAWTSYGVMTNLASCYNALSAYAEDDATLARQQITARNLYWGFMHTYAIGAFDGRNDGVPLSDSLPRFRTAGHATCQ